MDERLAYRVTPYGAGWHVYEMADEKPEPPKNWLFVDGYGLPIEPPASDWYIASSHSTKHSGLDINLDRPPYGDVELGMPVYATCNGAVVFAGKAAGKSWGNLVITMSLGDHRLEFWRYAHLDRINVLNAFIIKRGRQIGTIGKGYNDRYDAHLHLDGWYDRMIAPESWRSRNVEWFDPLDVWPKWKWGTR